MTFASQQPYQKASGEIQRQAREPTQGIQSLGLIAGKTLLGATVLGRVLPLLSSYIPSNIAMKGLNKLDPRFGKLFDGLEKAGIPIEEAFSFLKEKAGLSESQKSKQKQNLIQKYSDQLNQFLQNQIQQGRQLLEAGALAQLDQKFKNVISQMEKDYKVPFSSILENTFGNVQQSENIQQESQQSTGSSDQAIMAALDKILKM